MKFLKEADKIALWERALTNVDILYEAEVSRLVKVGLNSIRLDNNTWPTTIPAILGRIKNSSYSGVGVQWAAYANVTSFSVLQCGLSTLKGFPTELTELKNIDVSDNPIKSLEGLPADFKGALTAARCEHLKSLEHCPTGVKELSVDNCSELKNFIGAPIEVDSFSAERMKKLTSLKGLPKIINSWAIISSENTVALDCEVEHSDSITLDLPLTSLKNFHKAFKSINWLTLHVNDVDISSHILSLLLVKNLKQIILIGGGDVLEEAIAIVNKHLPNNNGMEGLLKCQDALLDAGLDQFAKL